MSSSMFPGRSQRPPDPYAGFVTAENVTVREEQRHLEAARLENQQRLAVARFYLQEFPVDEVKASGTKGRRFLVNGELWLLSEAFVAPGGDPTESGIEAFFVDRDGRVVLLHRPQVTGQRSLSDAAFGRRVA